MYDEAFQEILSHLEKVFKTIKKEDIEKFIDLILKHNKIFVYGAGRSGFMGRAFAQRLMHIGLNSYFIGETITPACRRGDLLIVISGSGETASCIALAEKAKKLGATVVAVTAHPESPLGGIADFILRVPGKTKKVEEKSYAPFTSLFDISVLTILDSISAEIMNRMGVDENLILERHATVE